MDKPAPIPPASTDSGLTAPPQAPVGTASAEEETAVVVPVPDDAEDDGEWGPL